MVGRPSSAPPPRPALWPWSAACSQYFCTGGSPWSSTPPPPPCALSGAAWVSQLRPLQARIAQLRPRSSTTPSPFDLCSWSRCPSCTFAAATAASMLHRYVGAKGPLLSSRLGDQRRRAAPQLGISTPKSRSALRSYRSVRWNVGGPSASPWYKGLSGWRKPSLWVLQRRFLRLQKAPKAAAAAAPAAAAAAAFGSLGKLGGSFAFPWYKGVSGWRKPSLWVLQRRSV